MWLPCSAIIPFSKTIILSASIIVDNLWAITRVVFLLDNFLRDFSIDFSVFESKADVASSKIKILGFLRRALAMATLCFSPPESFRPLSPTIVSYPISKLAINLSIDDNFAALLISSIDALGLD